MNKEIENLKDLAWHMAVTDECEILRPALERTDDELWADHHDRIAKSDPILALNSLLIGKRGTIDWWTNWENPEEKCPLVEVTHVHLAELDEGEGWADGGSLMLTVSSVGGELIQDDTIEEIDFDDFVEEGNEN